MEEDEDEDDDDKTSLVIVNGRAISVRFGHKRDSASDSAVASLHQNISVHLEKASIMTRIYPLSGKGPT